MILKSKRIYLRKLNKTDANGNYPNWLNNPIVCKYNSHGEINYTKEMALEYIAKVTDDPSYEVFAICTNDKKIHIGNIALQQISKKEKSAEYAILLGETSYMEQGYAKEASELLFRYGFETLNLEKIYCGTSELNLPMQKLATSLNMEKKQIHKNAINKNGKFLDIFFYAKMR